MIKAAIIDDGANPLQCLSLRQAFVVENNRLMVDAKPPEHSHASICLRIIEHYARETDVAWLSIRTLSPTTKRGNLDSFLCALNNCLELNVRLIHLSMGSSHYGDFQAIQSVVKRLTNAGIIIIAALSNSGIVTYPACLDGVVGVMCSSRLFGGTYMVLPKTFENIDFCASSIHELCQGNSKFTTPLSNSFAAPLITAKAVMQLKSNPTAQYDDIYSLLVDGAIKQASSVDFLSSRMSESKVDMPPTVAFVGFQRHELQDILIDLEMRFAREEYYCKTAVQAVYDVPSDFVKIPDSSPIDAFAEKVCRFFCCGILLLALEQIDINRKDAYGFIDIFIINDEDNHVESIFGENAEHRVIVSKEPDANYVFSQIISHFE